MFITTESFTVDVLSEEQHFYGVPVKLDPTVEAHILRVQAEGSAVSKYLRGIKSLASQRNDQDLTKMEVPECLKDVKVTPVAVSVSPPKKQASEATSSSKSQVKRKKIQSSSTTSRKKAKSSTAQPK